MSTARVLNRRLRCRRLVAATAFLLLAAALGAAQAAGGADSGPRRVLLVLRQAADAGYEADTLTFISRSLFAGLQMDVEVRAAQTVLVDSVGSEAPAADDALSAAAAAQGADAWLTVTISGGADSTPVHVRSLDVARQELVIDQDVTVEGTLTPLDLAATDWSGVAHLLADAYPAAGINARRANTLAPGTARLVINGRPESVVAIRGSQSVSLGSDGKAIVALDAPAQYVLRATAPGFLPVSRTIYLAATREIALGQQPAPRWAMAASVVDLAYPGASISWLFVPDIAFLSAGFTTYVAGLALNSTEAFSYRPLTSLIVETGAYLLPSDSIVRPYYSLGGFFRLVVAPEYVGLDPLAPGGFQLVLGAEIGGKPRGRLFLEWAPQFYVTQFPALLQASLGTGDTPPGWRFSAQSASEVLTLRLGYRWMP